VKVRFPASCAVDQRQQRLACAPGAFDGELRLDGVIAPAGGARMIVSLLRKDGTLSERVIEDDAPFVLVTEGPTKRDAPAPSWVGWAKIGAHHLITGFDHLAFLLGLLALVRSRRDLLLAITAFSAGHAVSLGLSVANIVAVPAAPTEALIALSVVLVAREALAQVSASASREQQAPTLLRRAPFLVSLLFGLVHGLGFAAALGDRGLPREGLAAALFAFHVGIEAAQLAVVALVAAVWAALARVEGAPAFLRTAGLYLVGTGGAYWLCERVAAVLRVG